MEQRAAVLTLAALATLLLFAGVAKPAMPTTTNPAQARATR